MQSLDSLAGKYFNPSEGIPSDVLSVASFPENTDNYHHRGMELFWDVICPNAVYLFSAEPPNLWIPHWSELPPLPAELEEALLQKLAELETQTRVPYEPDTDVMQVFDKLFTSVHVAGARALRLRRKVGYSDDVRQCLEGAWQTALWLHTEPYVGFSIAPVGIISLWAVTGLVLAELFRIQRLEGKYAEALHTLATGMEHIAAATVSVDQSAEEVAEDLQLDEELKAQELVWRDKLRHFLAPELGGTYNSETKRFEQVGKAYPPLFDVDENEAKEMFESLKACVGSHVDWKQVVRDCEALSKYWGLCVGYEGFEHEATVTDAEGVELTWAQFWNIGQGWATAQLRPSDLRELHRQEEEEGAERRLRTYFFSSGLWDQMPDRARRSLVEADRVWYSPTKTRFESTLNALQVAAETLFHRFFWEPLFETKGGREMLELVGLDTSLKEKGRNPTLANYSGACRHSSFKEFLANAKVTENDQRFLIRELPAAFDRLRKLRDSAQHNLKRTWRREEVEPVIREFVGIGSRGILPRLVEIGTKLTTKRSGGERASLY